MEQEMELLIKLVEVQLLHF